eukprot:6130973-Pleurochrysis_carterae.AAC.3
MDGRARRRVDPAWRRACMQVVAFEELRVTTHPPLVQSPGPFERENEPFALWGWRRQNGFISAKRHWVAEDSHNADTERSEPLKLGSHRTFLSVMATGSPTSFKAVSGRSPMATQRCGRPSIPAIRSSHGRVFTKSER